MFFLIKLFSTDFWDEKFCSGDFETLKPVFGPFFPERSFLVGSSFSCLVNSVYVTDLNVVHQFQVDGHTVAHDDFYRNMMSLTLFFRALKSHPKTYKSYNTSLLIFHHKGYKAM